MLMSSQVVKAITEYDRDVETGAFPASEHYAAMPKKAGEELRREFKSSHQLSTR